MKRKIFLFVLLLFLVTSLIGAIDLTIEYLEGYIDLKNGSAWDELYMGDLISDTAVIRLDEDSLAELTGRNIKLTISNPGIYKISELLKASENRDSINLGSMLSGKFQSMFKGNSVDVQSDVGGVRAAEVETNTSIDWMSSEAEELILSGKEYLDQNLFEKALALFEEGYDFAVDEDEEAEALFYAGYTYVLMGSMGDAIDSLDMIYDLDPYLEIYNDIFILKGQLLVETFAYDKAVSWFDEYIESDINYDEEDRQTIYLLKGISYKELGQISEAKEILQEAINIDNGSEMGKAASSILDMI